MSNSQNILITGASQGLGLDLAKSLRQDGHHLFLCARNAAKLQQAVEVLRQIPAHGHVYSQVVDVADRGAVEELAQSFFKKLGTPDSLILNAGIYGPKGSLWEVDYREWKYALDINLMGVVGCAQAFLPPMVKARRGKVVILSGGGATKPMPYVSAYAASKAGVVRLAETLALELKEYGIDVNTIAPGALNTRLVDEILEAGPEKVGQDFFNANQKVRESGGQGTEAASDLVRFLISPKSDGVTGKLISAIWDGWKNFPEHLGELQKTDVFTLRRIVPQERGLDWQ